MITRRRKEWVRQRESVKVLRWRLEAWWHLQPLRAPLRNTVINCRSHPTMRTEIKEQKKKHQKVINLTSILSCCLWFPQQYESGQRTVLPISCFSLHRSKRYTKIAIRSGSQPYFESTLVTNSVVWQGELPHSPYTNHYNRMECQKKTF